MHKACSRLETFLLAAAKALDEIPDFAPGRWKVVRGDIVALANRRRPDNLHTARDAGGRFAPKEEETDAAA